MSIPANPKIETTSYKVADGRSVPARVYSARQDKGQFKMTVADLANTGLDEKSVIDHAIKTLSEGAVVRVNVPARIYQSAHGQGGGWQPVDDRDVRYLGRLQQIAAKALPGANEFELTRFQQSLVFERGVTNRSSEEVRTIREPCPGLTGILNAAGNPVQPVAQTIHAGQPADEGLVRLRHWQASFYRPPPSSYKS